MSLYSKVRDAGAAKEAAKQSKLPLEIATARDGSIYADAVHQHRRGRQVWDGTRWVLVQAGTAADLDDYRSAVERGEV